MEVADIACSESEAAARALASSPDVVLLRYDLAYFEENGNLRQVLAKIGSRVLLMMEELTHESLCNSLRSGVHGFLTRKSGTDEVIKAIEKTHSGELWFGREAFGMALNSLREPRAQAEPLDDKLSLLTPRERKVVYAIVEHRFRTNKDLARQLFISESTLRNHLSSIYQKLGVSNRLDLYVYAQDCGVASPAHALVA